MANPKYGGFSYMGIGKIVTSLPKAIDATPATGDLIQVRLPSPCYISTVEVQVASISSATTLTMGVFRDAAGDEPLIDSGASGATRNITTGLTTAADGGVSYAVECDVNLLKADAAGSSTAGSVFSSAGADSGVATNTQQRLYFSINCNTGGQCNITRLVVNYRA